MSLVSLVDWLTWGALVLPLIVLAWSAWQYVDLRKRENSRHNFNTFFETLDRVNNSDGQQICQIAAIFELRNYPEYKDVILRICDNAEELFIQQGGAGNINVHTFDEFASTAEYLRTK